MQVRPLNGTEKSEEAQEIVSLYPNNGLLKNEMGTFSCCVGAGPFIHVRIKSIYLSLQFCPGSSYTLSHIMHSHADSNHNAQITLLYSIAQNNTIRSTNIVVECMIAYKYMIASVKMVADMSCNPICVSVIIYQQSWVISASRMTTSWARNRPKSKCTTPVSLTY